MGVDSRSSWHREYVTVIRRQNRGISVHGNYCAGEVQYVNFVEACLVVAHVTRARIETLSWNFYGKTGRTLFTVTSERQFDLIATPATIVPRDSRPRSRISWRASFDIDNSFGEYYSRSEERSEPSGTYIDRFTPRWNAFAISSAAMATSNAATFLFLPRFPPLPPFLNRTNSGAARALTKTHFSRSDRGLFESPRSMGEYTPFRRVRDFSRETFICYITQLANPFLKSFRAQR